MNSTDARTLYLRWLSRADPHLFALGVASADSSLSDIEEGLSGWVDTIVNAVVQVGGAVLQKKQLDAQVSAQKAKLAADAAASEQARQTQLQLTLLQTNTQRAAQGLPPVDINGRVLSANTLPQLPAGSLPTTANYYAQPSMLSQVPTWAYIAAGAVVLLLIVRR